MRRWLWPSFVLVSALAYGLGFWRGAAQESLLGTFLDPSGAPQPPAGLADDPNPPGLWAQLVSPLGWS